MRVDFVVAPFAAPQFPALGVSNLTVVAREAGHASRVLYENLRFWNELGCTLYDWIGPRNLNQQMLMGDFLFALLRRPEEERGDAMDRYLAGPVSTYVSEDSRLHTALHRELLDHVLPILERISIEAAGRILDPDPDIVGFTVGAFQSGAALHLAALVRARKPEARIWFGGHSCMGTIGQAYLRSFPVLDAVFCGESERALPEALARMERAESLVGIPGVVTRERVDKGDSQSAGDDVPSAVNDLDELPIPDFADYFAALGACGVERSRLRPYLLLESSRGCWWRPRGPCRFCGLDVHDRRFRSKSSSRMIREFEQITARHGIRDIQMVDSVLDTRYFRTLLPSLLEPEGPKVSLCYEIRAGLTREQMSLMRQAGVEVVQVGVEALDDEMLNLLNKGVSAVENLRTIKWCEELGIKLIYNLLFAIPGETTACYERLLARLALLHHLRPPNPASVRIDRYSSYEKDPERFGIQLQGPWSEALAHCYPEPGAEVDALSYHLRGTFLDPGAGHSLWWVRLLDALKEWKRDYYDLGKRLVQRDVGGSVFIEDNRFSAEVHAYELSPDQARVLEACEAGIAHGDLPEACLGGGMPEPRIQEALGFLLENKVLLDLGRQFIGLAVRTTRWPTDVSYRHEHSFLRRAIDGVRARQAGEGPEALRFSRLMRRVEVLCSRRQRELLQTTENRERSADGGISCVTRT